MNLIDVAAYIKEGDYNVIVIDWSKITLGTYAVARSYVRQVGIHLSGMINLLEEHGMDLSKTLLVGHSLGAHVVGIAARNAKGNVKYVIGKDLTFIYSFIKLCLNKNKRKLIFFLRNLIADDNLRYEKG